MYFSFGVRGLQLTMSMGNKNADPVARTFITRL